MLREIVTHSHKAAESTYKAAVAMRTGMAVVKKADGTFAFPTSTEDMNLYVTQKAMIPTGVNAGKTWLSDYEEEFNTFAEGELGVLYQFDAGEVFGTDAYTEALAGAAVGAPVVGGTDGKWDLGSAESLFRFRGMKDDAGHKLAWIEVLAVPATNA